MIWSAQAQSTLPQLVNFSPEQQANATTFINERCYPQANGILAQIQNGFAVPVVFTVVLQCQGTGNATFDQTVAPFNVTEPFLIQPATGTVANRICNLLLTGIDPHDSSPLPTKSVFRNYTTTCGSVRIRNRDFDEDEDDDCHFADAPCEYNKGSWYYGFLPTLIHALILTTILLIPYAGFVVLGNKSVENLIIGISNSSKEYREALNEALAKWERSEDTHPAHTGYRPGGGRMVSADECFMSSDEDEYDDDDDSVKIEVNIGSSGKTQFDVPIFGEDEDDDSFDHTAF